VLPLALHAAAAAAAAAESSCQGMLGPSATHIIILAAPCRCRCGGACLQDTSRNVLCGAVADGKKFELNLNL
jgi:hypothetical protein